MLILFGAFFVLLMIGMPVAFSMLCSAVLYSTIYGESISMVFTRVAAGPASFTLMALAFFILAGNIMNNGGVTDQIFGFCKKLIGWVPGGLAHANVLASVIFAGMSGAAVADAGGLGAIEVKAMRDDGFDDEFSVAVTGASSIIGPIIPPSIPAVVFAVAAGISVGKLLIGGILPGLLLALVMMIYIYFVSKRRNYVKHRFEGFRSLGSAFMRSLPALLTPVIILGGIMSGVCTPTEASAIAVFYALVLSLTTRNLSIRDLPEILDETILTTMSVLFIVGCANALAYLVTIAQLPQTLLRFFGTFITNKYTFLLLINLFLLIVGMLMESLSALTLLTPILVPLANIYGIDTIHFGIIMILNLMLGMLTPPVGMVLFVLARMTAVPFEKICRAMMPFIVMCLIALLIIAVFPPIVLLLPNIMIK
ncbi:TRAP transporter large permease [Oribacterium sp. oral taxon 102]|uniref:TRAP transporter large permease n=1 Tax=Oribacterium sp. oral taxon 102 TaxID=671214 RepID=UPI0015BF1B3A|nr:TRAP transporter large permease [Oribacterium sp. oral taxon 102]NWO22021.1 TRAP transporter large permease [Oribacterium sp. oral taxon 102]